MKYSVVKVVVYAVVLAVVALAAGCRDSEVVFQVNDVVSDPGAFSKELTLEGVVYARAQGNASIVGVVDKKELQCKTPNCKKALLAVQTTGAPPTIGSEIKVSGAIVKESWGYVLKAEAVEVIARHNLGG